MCDPLHNRELWRHSWHYSPFNVDTNWDNDETMNASFKVPETKEDKPNKKRPRSHSTAVDAWPGGLSAPHSTRTAPATPIRDLLNGSASTSEDNLPNGISKSSSTPLLDDPNPSWEWSQMNKAHDERIAPLLEAANQRHYPGYNVTESVLQKFRKSFSLRFYKKSSSNSSASSQPEPLHPTSKQYESQHSNDFEPPDSPPHTDQKFRFGPLIWRSSKERRKGKKASRNQKCNSGDSGIQIEMVGRGTGDSSESHDTDHLADEEILDDTDSPLVVRRRPGLSYGSEGKASRPTSDLINQVLIDKLKTELQSRGLPRRHGQAVRRTHSDLGGQRLFHWDVCHSYRKMMSSPSPVKMRNQEYTASGGGDSQAKTKKIRPHPTLRRSVSQPLGLNELSPLLRRKPIGSRTSNTLSDDDKPSSGNQGQTGSVCSDDELLSDSESSVTSLGDRKRGCGMDDDFVVLAEAVWDHIAMEPEELGFRAGDVIEVLDTMDRDWWWGTRGEASGWFPAAFVRLRVSQEDTVEDCLAALASGGSKTLRRRTSISLLSNDQVRSRVVRELINTERDFVKVLHDVSEGYLAECRRRSDMFSSEQIQTIFGNLEHILAFQTIFLEDLETKLDWEAPYKSCIGETFLKHKSGFRMYSEYCNSHPMAIATLQELYQHNNYSKFFEACRLMRGLIEIPLDGYLLTPVQRICKYPLQLAELLKYTKTDHPDYVKITEALEAMRDVAMLINERKRRMESLEKLAAWQQRVEGWEAEDLIETSSQLIHQGEVIRVTSGMWTNSITLFLFDHQLVYCKRDILKRNTHVYKARLNIDTSQIINLPDGKDPHLGVSVRHAIKVHCTDKDKWLLFCCRSNEDKARWLAAFEQERALVEQDREDGLEFAPAAKELARMSAARCHSSRPPVKHRSKRSSNQVSPNATITPRSHSLGRRVGTWFNFGANKKNRTFTRAATLQTVVHPS